MRGSSKLDCGIWSGLLWLGCCLLAFGGCKRSAENKTVIVQGRSVPSLHSRNLVLRLEGTIGEMPVVVNLTKDSTGCSGSYYYSKIGIAIPLEQPWSDSSKPKVGDTIFLVEEPYGDTVANHLALFVQSDSEIFGTWEGDKRTVPIKLHSSYPEGSYWFTQLTVVDSSAFDLRPTLRSTLTASYGLPLPQGDMPDYKQKFVLGKLREWFGIKDTNSSTDIRTQIEHFPEDYFKGALAELKQQAEGMADSDIAGAWMFNWNVRDHMSVRISEDDFVVLDNASSYYSGGAHDSYSSTCHVLDLREKKELSLDDVTTADSATLEGLLEVEFRKQYHLAPDAKLSSRLFHDYLPPNTNFYLTRKGIGFVYNPYEIASFADGIIEVFVPFSELKGRLTPWFVKRANL